MWSIFKDNNEWNEKTIVGFIAFLVMVLFALFHPALNCTTQISSLQGDD